MGVIIIGNCSNFIHIIIRYVRIFEKNFEVMDNLVSELWRFKVKFSYFEISWT